MFLFKSKKPIEPKKEAEQVNVDLELVTKMNQDFALSLDLNDTLMNALRVIIARLNAEAANIFLINEQKKKFECIASLHQDYLDEYELDLKDGVMGKAVQQRKCIRVGNVRKDVREIAEFYFDLDNKTNFTTYSVLCSPLIAANECIGVIHCLNKKTEDKLFIEDEKNITLQKYYMTLTEECGINIECINLTEPYDAPHLSYAFQWLFFAICLSIVILRKNKLI